MPYEYCAENHDWDMTLRASWNLVMVAQAAKDNREISFSCFTGGMLLAFCAVESFLNSVAFQMSRDSKFTGFSYSKYLKARGVWDKIKFLYAHIGLEFDQASEPLKTFEKMRVWRTALVHAKPYNVEPTMVEDPSSTHELHTEFTSREYTRAVSMENAKAFYKCGFDVIDIIKKASGLEPRAMCSYKVT